VSARFTLILETTTPEASLAVAADDGFFTGREFQSDRHHNALLFGPLAELLAGVAVGSVGRVLVGSGPGSYSGTRVGIAAAQGVALAAGCPVVAVPSPVAVPLAAQGGGCLFLGDARRGAFWTARVDGGRLVSAPALTDAAGLRERVEAALAAGHTLATMEEITRFSLLGDLGGEIRQEIPTAAGLWRAWQRADEAERGAWAAAPPQPIYLKPPHITVPKRSWLAPS
jgi:tRNA threonylcarbamoyl adenosine modification protein YeaZ